MSLSVEWPARASAIRRAESIDECRDIFKNSIALHGFDTFACGELDLIERDRHAFFVIDWPDQWRQFYVEQGLISRDPLLDALRIYNRPFTWSELKKERDFSPEGRRVFADAAARGWHDGLVVPIPRARASRFGLVSLVGHQPSISQGLKIALEALSVCFFERVRALVPHEGFAVAPAGLTRREIACIQKVSLGLSDKEIGREIGIAASTAHEHVESAKKKLRARNRAELVAIAVSLSIIPA